MVVETNPVLLTLLLLGVVSLAMLATRLWRRWRQRPGDDRVLRAYLNEYLVMNAFDGLVISDMRGRVEWANPAYLRMQGYDLEEIRGKNPLAFALPPEDTPSVEHIEAFAFDPARHGQIDEATFVNQRPDGTRFHNHISFIVTPTHPRFQQKALLVCRDISDQLAAEAHLRADRDRMRSLAERDPLTGLANRARLMEQMESALKNAGTVLGVMQIDLDHFKAVNDGHGHAAGDAVLVHVADVLANLVRKNDLAARVGGDEFVLLLVGGLTDEALIKRAEQIRDGLIEPIEWNGFSLKIGCSIGITRAEPGSTGADTLLAEADHALYSVKNNGRNGIRLYSERVRKAHCAAKTALSRLETALADDLIEPVLEPIHDVTTGRIRSFRFFLSYLHEAQEYRSIDSVSALAQSPSTLDHCLDLMCRSAAAAVNTLAASAQRDVTLCLSLPRPAGLQPGMLDRLKWACEQTQAPPASLFLTVPEPHLGAPGSAAAATMGAAHDAGFRLTVTDFGTADAAIGALLRLNIASIHLSPHIVQGIAGNIRQQHLCRSILDLCGSLDIRPVATGVSAREDVEVLSRLGCTGFLGPWVAPPLSLPQAQSILRKSADAQA